MTWDERWSLGDGTCEMSIGLPPRVWDLQKGHPEFVVRGTPLQRSSQWRVLVKDKAVKGEYVKC